MYTIKNKKGFIRFYDTICIVGINENLIIKINGKGSCKFIKSGRNIRKEPIARGLEVDRYKCV